MTIWAFLSDIHGNRPALGRALGLCRERGVQRFAFLGDLLGRGDSEGVVALVRDLADLAVVGNRDLDWAGRVSPASRAYVLGLPRQVEADGFVAVHGDPRLDRALNVTDVRRGAPRAYAWLRQHGRRLLFFGHTHQAQVWRKAGPDAPLEALAGPRVLLRLDQPETVYLVNVGTVGLPFAGKGPASCTLLEDNPAGAWVKILSLERR